MDKDVIEMATEEEMASIGMNENEYMNDVALEGDEE